MGYRYNERNIGSYTLSGEQKVRRGSKKLTIEEKELAKEVLQKVLECLEFDKELSQVGHLSPAAKFTDGGRFMLMINRGQLDALYNVVDKL